MSVAWKSFIIRSKDLSYCIISYFASFDEWPFIAITLLPSPPVHCALLRHDLIYFGNLQCKVMLFPNTTGFVANVHLTERQNGHSKIKMWYINITTILVFSLVLVTPLNVMLLYVLGNSWIHVLNGVLQQQKHPRGNKYQTSCQNTNIKRKCDLRSEPYM